MKHLRQLLNLKSIIILSGIAAHLVFFGVIEMILAEDSDVIFEAAYLEYRGPLVERANEVLEQQSVLYDAKPLFLPTVWGFGASAKSAAFSVDPFRAFKPQLTLGRSELWPSRMGPQGALRSSLDALLWERWDVLGVFAERGRRDALPEVDREAWVRIRDMATGRIVLETALEPYAGWGEELHAPSVDFLQFIDIQGAMGNPLQLNKLGEERADDTIRGQIAEPILLHSLRPGYYRIEVAP